MGQRARALRSTPGITITQTGRRQGKYALEGLRDPFAVPVEEVLTKNGVAAAAARNSNFAGAGGYDCKISLRPVSLEM